MIPVFVRSMRESQSRSTGSLERTKPAIPLCGAWHGWGSRVFNPASVETRVDVGTNRNILVSNAQFDPLSQTPKLSSTTGRLKRLPPTAAVATSRREP
jgi:hypothetical protein